MKLDTCRAKFASDKIKRLEKSDQIRLLGA